MVKKTVVGSLLFCLSAVVMAEEFFYVYKDDKNRTYIEDSVSENHAKFGYRVVNTQGVTIKTVPGSAELQARDEKRRKHAQASHVKQTEREQDEYLLRSFIDAEDIRLTGNKKIMAIQAQIDTTNGHIKAFEENLLELEAQIERADLNKREISQEEVDSIKRIKESIKLNKLFVLHRIEQQQKVREEYVEYMKRYQEVTAKK